ncbi:sensor histidine kinase [Pseudoruegeria sp. SHC-113]|uniref:sensor histidine kinase n=1 Tax=Pseudoruegeria sp. SHC-113 TaxID=2855439 RepID=UPI0021BB7B1A|nr:sensor histidine kinase [Pseudoruegeria sp. SHC-113]MCT8159282.1 sensor histidine kinase [Pseudoruegeria sp. SHC-113]
MTLAPEIDVRDGKSRSANVLLGEDWENPTAGGDGELSARRARRGFIALNRSALARKIITFNLLALIILVAGVLYLNPVRSSLVEQRDAGIVSETALVASVFEAQIPASVPVNLATGDGVDVQRTLDALSLPSGTEAFVFDANGTLVGQAMGALDRDGGSDAQERSTLITDFLNSVWESISGVLGPDSPAVEATPLSAEDIARDLLPTALESAAPAQVTQEGEGGERFAVVSPILQNGSPVGAVALTSAAGEIDRLVRQDREQVLQMFVVALLVSIGLSLALASTIANPLSDLAEAAELGRDRNARKMSPSRIRIPDLTARPDEIGRLSGALRGMVTALYDRIDANEQFAADVAHEIKNPLASLRSAVGTLRVAKRDDQREKLLDVIDHDVRRLDRLVSDISNASRLDSELVREEEEAFDLLKMLGNINEYLGNEARTKGIEFISDLPSKPIIVMGLEARLAQVFVNLITNAISFCEDGDAIRVWARKRENRILIVVEDTGPGIPDQALHKIFNRFYSERPPGQFGNNSGLGLAISKQIVEAHDGVIWAENIRPTEADVTSEPLGARFVVGLPV